MAARRVGILERHLESYSIDGQHVSRALRGVVPAETVAQVTVTLFVGALGVATPIYLMS